MPLLSRRKCGTVGTTPTAALRGDCPRSLLWPLGFRLWGVMRWHLEPNGLLASDYTFLLTRKPVGPTHRTNRVDRLRSPQHLSRIIRHARRSRAIRGTPTNGVADTGFPQDLIFTVDAIECSVSIRHPKDRVEHVPSQAEIERHKSTTSLALSCMSATGNRRRVVHDELRLRRTAFHSIKRSVRSQG